MLETPAIVKTTAQATAIIRFTIPRDQIRAVMGPGHSELMATLDAQGIAPTGRWFTHHLRMDPETFDFELGVPVDRAVAATGRVQAGQLPAVTCARAVYRGSYEGLGGAWAALNAWIAAQGHAPAPSLWETYVTDPASNPDPATWRTELTRPIS